MVYKKPRIFHDLRDSLPAVLFEFLKMKLLILGVLALSISLVVAQEEEEEEKKPEFKPPPRPVGDVYFTESFSEPDAVWDRY